MILTPSNSAPLILPFRFTVTFNLSKRDLAEVPSPLLTLMFSSLRRFFLSSVYGLLITPASFFEFGISLPGLSSSKSKMLSSLQPSSNVVSAIFKDKNMKRLSLLLDSGKNEVYLERFINTRSDSKMEVRTRPSQKISTTS